MNLFRIVQEHLNNILKHANATRVTIVLTQSKESVILDIFDDGVGFDTSKKYNGIGVANINARAVIYNGIAKIMSKPGKGCALNIAFPVGPGVAYSNSNSN